MLKILGIGFAIVLMSGMAQAEVAYPTRPVALMVPYAPGGPSDVASRILADELTKVWKQQVVILNKPGGGTIIGTTFAAQAPADGYTLAFAGGSYVVNAALRKNMPYDALRDFRGITVFDDSPIDIVAHKGFPAQTLPELIELAKQRNLTFASAGIGSIAHMTGELLAQVTGIKLRHISYSGDAAALPDVMSGRVDFRMGSWSDDRRYVEAGQLKLVSIVYPKRLQEAPNTPTVNEIIPSMAKYPAGVFNSIVVSKAVPTEIVEKISAAMKIALASDSFKQRISALGLYPRYTTPEETDKFLKAQIDTWADIGKTANITFE
jgi:tripartite-type tricarboxylate transporter receptor subunit TctC